MATAILQRGLWDSSVLGMVIYVKPKIVIKYWSCRCTGTVVPKCFRIMDIGNIMITQPDFLEHHSALQELVYGRAKLVDMLVK